MSGWIAALLSGALMSLQGVFNTQATKQTGPWLTNSFVQLSGFVVCVLIWYFKERKNAPVTALFSVEPRYYLLGGVIGAFITFTVICGMSALGPAKAVMLIVATQLIVAYLIEVFGLFGAPKAGFDWMKLLGTGLFLAGIFVFKARG